MDEYTVLRSVKDLNNIEQDTIRFFDSSPEKMEIDIQSKAFEYPTICSFCNRTGDQECIEIIGISGEHEFDAVGVFYCKYCKNSTVNFFINEKFYYMDEENAKTHYPYVLTVADQSPRLTYQNEIPEIVQAKYKDFFDIYNQAATAESSNLLHLAGMGYRKSIEFLVTDFLKDYPTDDSVTHEWLENPETRLKQKIEKLPNQRLIRTGTAIAYLGNDETHYTSRHPDFNLQHMKKFIGLLIKELESEFIYDNVESFLG